LHRRSRSLLISGSAWTTRTKRFSDSYQNISSGHASSTTSAKTW
jgi:hypothetical protein